MHGLETIRVLNEIASVRAKVKGPAKTRPETLTRKANGPSFTFEALTDDGSKTAPHGDPLTAAIVASIGRDADDESVEFSRGYDAGYDAGVEASGGCDCGDPGC